MYIDTHAHLGMMVKSFDTPLADEHFPLIESMIAQAHAVEVKKIITIGTNFLESLEAVMIAQRFSSVFATIGIHPCDGTDAWHDEVQKLKKILQKTKPGIIVGIGETGLDFYHKPFHKQRQIDMFKAHVDLALDFSLPLVLHVRDAAEELLYALEPYVKDVKGGVIHCFLQNKDFAATVVNWGFYCGIGAPISYPKNQELRDVVATIPLELLLLETDAPFLPPVALRGKKNMSAYIPQFAPVLAQIKKVSEDLLADQTTSNAHRLFTLERQ